MTSRNKRNKHSNTSTKFISCNSKEIWLEGWCLHNSLTRLPLSLLTQLFHHEKEQKRLIACGNIWFMRTRTRETLESDAWLLHSMWQCFEIERMESCSPSTCAQHFNLKCVTSKREKWIQNAFSLLVVYLLAYSPGDLRLIFRSAYSRVHTRDFFIRQPISTDNNLFSVWAFSRVKIEMLPRTPFGKPFPYRNNNVLL